VTREGQGRVEVASRLTAPAQAVWERVSTFDGVNDELMPLMRMTSPRRMRSLQPEDVVLGQRLFRSWVLLFGFIPFDYDDLTLIALEPGRGFHERSSMLSMRTWEHERWIEPDGDGACTVRDRLTFEPRPPFSPRLAEHVVRRIFRHRHKRLRRHFGG